MALVIMTDSMKVAAFDIGTKNLAFCIVRSNDSSGWDIVKWGIWDIRGDATKRSPATKRKPKTLAIEDIFDRVQYHISYNEEAFEGVDVILIEDQPPRGHIVMKRVQFILWTMLRMMYPGARVACIPSSRKLEVKPDTETVVRIVSAKEYREDKARLSYASRKKESVLRTKEILRIECKSETLDVFKKKDDVADCFLMCMHALFR